MHTHYIYERERERERDIQIEEKSFFISTKKRDKSTTRHIDTDLDEWRLTGPEQHGTPLMFTHT